MNLADVAGLWSAWLGPEWGPPVWALVKNTASSSASSSRSPCASAFLTLWERKAHRLDADPHRTEPRRPPGPACKPFADVLKLVFKEIIVPTGRNKFLFVTGRC